MLIAYLMKIFSKRNALENQTNTFLLNSQNFLDFNLVYVKL